MHSKIKLSNSGYCLLAKSERFSMSYDGKPTVYVEFMESTNSNSYILDYYNVVNKSGSIGLSYCPIKPGVVHIYLPNTTKLTSLVVRQAKQ